MVRIRVDDNRRPIARSVVPDGGVGHTGLALLCFRNLAESVFGVNSLNGRNRSWRPVRIRSHTKKGTSKTATRTTCRLRILEDGPSMATNNGQHGQPEPTDRRRLIASVGWSLLILVLWLFLPAGTWSWARGWLFILVVVAASTVITMYLRRVNPDVVAARVNRHDGTKRWDLLLRVIFILPTMLAVPIVAALDDGRYHWSHLP